MALFTRTADNAQEINIHYEIFGSGFPVLAIPPGGMRAAGGMWERMPWSPLEKLADRYQVISMDQRNAGQSWAPVSAKDSWIDYAQDQIALLDHLGITSCHVIGSCIAGSYIAQLLLLHPERFRSAVIMQTIGLDNNRDTFFEMFDSWASDNSAQHPEATTQDFESFKIAMFGTKDFLFSTTQEESTHISTPILILQGDDLYHPRSISEQLARSTGATLITEWKTEETRDAGITSVLDFLSRSDNNSLPAQ